ncbi:GMC oxidoreductase [Nakamurella endophytica]|uniref:GMC oxidoreductase n=1 Tax=Nakamurella endophytica TaxID=1748367 RepID=UPI001E47AA4C|nr:GMC oxidoreductase [Nakamurella endophytica]
MLDVLVPADGYPSAVDAGALPWFDRLATGPHAALWADVLGPGLAALQAEGRPVDATLVGELETADHRAGWPVPPARLVSTLVGLAAQAYYGQRDSPAWDEIGYRAAPDRAPGAPVRFPWLPQAGLDEVEDRYDVVVVGAGAGGGVAARVLSDAGARVLVVERGRLLGPDEVGRDHLANHRLPVYGHNTGASRGNPRVVAGPDGADVTVPDEHDPRWSNNAQTVGGGTRVYQGMAWRFHPDDFRMASLHGVPEDSSLADWPLTYDDLEPFYRRAEWEFGVCGDGAAHARQGPRSAPYPLPPFPDNPEAVALRAGAAALGLTTGPVPLLINSVPRAGRAACVRCGECVGFACPSDAKNGSHNTVLPLALATGRCTLLSGARVEQVEVDGTGAASGVRVVDVRTGRRRRVAARTVVLAAGAVETARLLLASRTADHPGGLGNRHDQVGRHLQGHVYAGAYGYFPDPVQDSAGPGVSIATLDYVQDRDGTAVSGGVLANEVVKLPVLYWLWGAAGPDAPRWGALGKAAVRDRYRRTGHVWGPVQEVPSPRSRVTLAAGVRDAHGAAVARLSGGVHPETLRAAELHRDRAARWLSASGADAVWSPPPPAGLSAGQHQAGTARMGTDPGTSVTDPHGRVHGHPGLWVMDASLHVTNGGVNPVLTVLALAYRNSAALARQGW